MRPVCRPFSSITENASKHFAGVGHLSDVARPSSALPHHHFGYRQRNRHRTRKPAGPATPTPRVVEPRRDSPTRDLALNVFHLTSRPGVRAVQPVVSRASARQMHPPRAQRSTPPPPGLRTARRTVRERPSGRRWRTCRRSVCCVPHVSWDWGLPGDLSVIGYDNVPLADWFVPRLTTVNHPLQAMVSRSCCTRSKARNHRHCTRTWPLSWWCGKAPHCRRSVCAANFSSGATTSAPGRQSPPPPQHPATSATCSGPRAGRCGR